MKRSLIAICALLALASAARADWQDTQWNMPAQQFKTLYPQAALQPKDPKNPSVNSYAMPYRANGVDFTAKLSFDSTGLILVELTAKPGSNCEASLGALRQRYNAPRTAENVNSIRIYSWETPSDVILYTDSVTNGRKDACWIAYGQYQGNGNASNNDSGLTKRNDAGSGSNTGGNRGDDGSSMVPRSR